MLATLPQSLIMMNNSKYAIWASAKSGVLYQTTSNKILCNLSWKTNTALSEQNSGVNLAYQNGSKPGCCAFRQETVIPSIFCITLKLNCWFQNSHFGYYKIRFSQLALNNCISNAKNWYNCTIYVDICR